MLHVDQALVRRIGRMDALGFANAVAGYQRHYPDLGAEALWVGGGVAVWGGPTCPFNSAISLGLEEPVTPAIFGAIEAFYARHDAPSRLEIVPLADPSLLDLARERGYGVEFFINEHAHPLSPTDSLPPLPSGVRIERVGPEQGRLWAQTVQRGFRSQDDAPFDEPATAMTTLGRPGVTCYLAYLDDEPAGAGGLAVHEGLASLFSTSVRPRFRGRGVQTALLRARLADAAAAGCDLALVSTDPGSASERNVLRAGFRTLFTRAVLIRPLP